MTKRETAIVIVERAARKRAKKAGRVKPNTLDRVPVAMDAEGLRLLRLAFGIKA
jgi:hypothetical protein